MSFRFSVKEKLEILNIFETGDYTWREISSLYNVSLDSLSRWKYNYDKYGVDGLVESKTHQSYSAELKLAAIIDYETGDYSLRDVIKKYNISSTSVLRKWIKSYNGHREIKSCGEGLDQSVTRGRTTTWKERIEIVYDCLAANKDYNETANKYKVSYQQVYQWVRKHESDGIDALKDRRGRKKTEDELTSEEKMELEISRIEKENERLRAENAFLKKLKEMERRRF